LRKVWQSVKLLRKMIQKKSPMTKKKEKPLSFSPKQKLKVDVVALVVVEQEHVVALQVVA
jgi:hypothetical protein